MPLDRDPPDPGLTDLEAALRSLSPSPAGLDRDRLMYRAGLAAPRRPPGRSAWPTLSAALAVVAIGEGVMLADPPGPQIIERVVIVREPSPPAPAVAEAPAVEWNTPQWRRHGFDLDAEGLPVAPSRGVAVAVEYESSGRWLRSETAKIAQPGDPS